MIGLLGSALICFSYFPQTYKTIKKGRTKDLSYGFMVLNIMAGSLMLFYGVYYKIIPMIIANGSVIINSIIITIYMIRHTQKERQISAGSSLIYI